MRHSPRPRELNTRQGSHPFTTEIIAIIIHRNINYVNDNFFPPLLDTILIHSFYLIHVFHSLLFPERLAAIQGYLMVPKYYYLEDGFSHT